MAPDAGTPLWSTSDRVLLVHAQAEGLGLTTALDDFRGLNQVGWLQARQIAVTCAHLDIRALLSGGALRCRQSLMPLAEASGLDIEPLPQLSRRTDIESAMTLLSSADSHGTVLCTHAHLAAELLTRVCGHPTLRLDVACGSAWRVTDEIDDLGNVVTRGTRLETRHEERLIAS